MKTHDLHHNTSSKPNTYDVSISWALSPLLRLTTISKTLISSIIPPFFTQRASPNNDLETSSSKATDRESRRRTFPRTSLFPEGVLPRPTSLKACSHLPEVVLTCRVALSVGRRGGHQHTWNGAQLSQSVQGRPQRRPLRVWTGVSGRCANE